MNRRSLLQGALGLLGLGGAVKALPKEEPTIDLRDISELDGPAKVYEMSVEADPEALKSSRHAKYMEIKSEKERRLYQSMFEGEVWL